MRGGTSWAVRAVFLVFLCMEGCWAHRLTGDVVGDVGDAGDVGSSSSNNASTGLSSEEIARKELITASSTRIMLGFLLQVGAVVLSSSLLASNLYRASHAFDLGPKGCASDDQCKVLTVVFLLAILAQGLVYFLVVRPKKTEGESGIVRTLRDVGTAAYAVTSLLHLLALFVLWHAPGSRLVSFLMTTVLAFTLLAVLSGQIMMGTVLGEWTTEKSSNYDQKGTWYDATISSSMDNLPGMLTAAFGLSVVVSMIVVVEAFHFEQHQQPTRYKMARMIAALATSIGMFLVAVTPLYNKNMEGIIAEDTLKSWGRNHLKFAAVAFGGMFVYEMIATKEACEERKCSTSSQVGRGLAVVAVVTMAVSLGWMLALPTSYPPILDALFAMGEYLMIVTPPLVLLGRFDKTDLFQLSKALVAISKASFPNLSTTLGRRNLHVATSTVPGHTAPSKLTWQRQT